MTIIGLGYNVRSGKDTAANALVRDLGYYRIAFADKLKELAYESNPIVTTNVQVVNISTGAGHLKHVVGGMGGWEQAKDSYPLAREFLQNLGLAARQVFGEDFWVDQALSGIDPAKNYVISDVRFVNEVDAIKAAGGIVIHVDRKLQRTAGHVSETELDDYDGWDAVLDNSNGTAMDLERRAVELVPELTTPKPKVKVAEMKVADKLEPAKAADK